MKNPTGGEEKGGRRGRLSEVAELVRCDRWFRGTNVARRTVSPAEVASLALFSSIAPTHAPGPISGVRNADATESIYSSHYRIRVSDTRVDVDESELVRDPLRRLRKREPHLVRVPLHDRGGAEKLNISTAR